MPVARSPEPLPVSASWRRTLAALLARWDVEPKDWEHYQRAFTHPSAVEDQAQSYELYEFMGDALIDVVVIEALVRRHPDELVGNLAKAKGRVVSTGELAGLSEQLDLMPLLQMDAGIGRDKALSAGVKADIYESLIGAIFLDRGYTAARKVLRVTLKEILAVDIAERKAEDFKSLLQERVQSLFKEVPSYDVVTTTGPEHEKLFRVLASFHGIPLAQGSGRSKKEAEQDSARKTLAQFDRYFRSLMEELGE